MEVTDLGTLPKEAVGTAQKHIEANKFENKGGGIVAARAKDFAGEVSVAGVKYVFHVDAGIIRKLTWALIVLLSIAFTVYQIQERTRYYLRYPTAVNQRIDYASKLRFPTVTICNENTVDKSQLLTMGDEALQIIQTLYPSDPAQAPAVNISAIDFSHFPDFGEVYKELSPPKEKAIVDCTFGNRSCNSSFFKTVATNIAYCYQFNTEEQNFYVDRAGDVGSLRLTLYVDQLNYLVQNNPAAGFRVLLHDPMNIPLMAEWAFRVGPGVVTQALVTIRETTQLPAPHGDCMDRENYTTSRCLNLCEANNMIKHCNCKDSYHPGNVSICNPRQRYECADSNREEFIYQNLASKCDCPQQCAKNYYFTELSTAPLSQQVVQTFARSIDPTGTEEGMEDFVVQNYGMLEIFFPELSYEEIVTIKAYDLLSLICDIGGALGLLLGSTILTIFEVLDFAIVTGADLMRLNKVKTKNKAQQLA